MRHCLMCGEPLYHEHRDHWVCAACKASDAWLNPQDWLTAVGVPKIVRERADGSS